MHQFVKNADKGSDESSDVNYQEQHNTDKVKVENLAPDVDNSTSSSGVCVHRNHTDNVSPVEVEQGTRAKAWAVPEAVLVCTHRTTAPIMY